MSRKRAAKSAPIVDKCEPIATQDLRPEALKIITAWERKGVCFEADGPLVRIDCKDSDYEKIARSLADHRDDAIEILNKRNKSKRNLRQDYETQKSISKNSCSRPIKKEATPFSNGYKDGRWYKRRTEIFERDGYQCVLCSSTEDIQCHHHWYIKDRNLWDYADSELSTLCKSCHERQTELQQQMRLKLCGTPPGHLENLLRNATYKSTEIMLNGIVLQVVSRDQSDFRMARLRKVLTLLVSNHPETSLVVSILSDMEDILNVYLKPFYSQCHIAIITQSWRECGGQELKVIEAF